jgi:hypothetical protein
MQKIIYQFCIHNYQNEFEMLSRISYTIENYKEEMMPIEDYCYNHDFLKEYSEMLLVDIIPPFLKPKIFKFDFNDFESEDEMMKEITNTTQTYRPNIEVVTETLVIHLIHRIPEF